MSNVKFTKAVRENVGLWINLIGGTGSGKSFTAMRLASGIAGNKPFAVIDTENRRALHYADQFNFDHLELRPPFRPAAFLEAVQAADAAGYPVIVIDSGSHVWSGEGGILDWQEEELKRLGGGENVKMLSWVKPKMSHKKMVQGFLGVKAHIILCLRAEEKIEMVKVGNRTEIRPKATLTGLAGWVPICDKALPFEATVSLLLIADQPGIPHPIKLQEQHRHLFPLDVPVTEASGAGLAAWARGGEPAPKPDTLDAKRAAIMLHFGELGVSSDRILRTAGVSEPRDIGENEVVKLRALAVDVMNGDKSLLEAFPLLTEVEEDPDAEAERAAMAGE